MWASPSISCEAEAGEGRTSQEQSFGKITTSGVMFYKPARGASIIFKGHVLGCVICLVLSFLYDAASTGRIGKQRVFSHESKICSSLGVCVCRSIGRIGGGGVSG